MRTKKPFDLIVIHCGQEPRKRKEATTEPVTSQPFHYNITANATIEKLRAEIHNVLSISVEGCADKHGQLKQTPTRLQEEALFDLVVELTEHQPKAKVLGREDLAGLEPKNQVFNVKHWLANYVPDLETAA